MLVNVSEDDEYRIAVVEDKVLEELYLERTKVERHVGDVYLGRVQNVEASIEAAFVEIGTEKHGFLHVSDIRPDVQDIPPKKTPSTWGAASRPARRARSPGSGARRGRAARAAGGRARRTARGSAGRATRSGRGSPG